MAKPSAPVPMHCVYRVKPGREAEFLHLLEKHWPALRDAGLATAEPATVIRCEGKTGGVFFVEHFSWIDAEASAKAHRRPEVLAVWGPMEPLLDGMEFAVRTPVPMPWA